MHRNESASPCVLCALRRALSSQAERHCYFIHPPIAGDLAAWRRDRIPKLAAPLTLALPPLLPASRRHLLPSAALVVLADAEPQTPAVI